MNRQTRILLATMMITGIVLVSTFFDTSTMLQQNPGLFLLIFVLAMTTYLLVVIIFNNRKQN